MSMFRDGELSVYFTASFRPFPALNTGTFLAAILMTAPVWGFLPVRAFLLVIPNVPKKAIPG